MRPRLVLVLSLALASAGVGASGVAHADTTGCTIVTVGQEVGPPWHCAYTAVGPTTYSVATVTPWEIRKWVDGTGYVTVVSGAGPDAKANETAGTVAGDYVELVVWPSPYPYVGLPIYAYRDGYLTASSTNA